MERCPHEAGDIPVEASAVYQEGLKMARTDTSTCSARVGTGPIGELYVVLTHRSAEVPMAVLKLSPNLDAQAAAERALRINVLGYVELEDDERWVDDLNVIDEIVNSL
jgi:hypothetical protein